MKKMIVSLCAAAWLMSVQAPWLSPAPALASSVGADSEYREKVGSYGMLPIYPAEIREGVYPVDAETNSRYFKLHDLTLTVEGQQMEVSFTIDSTSYGFLFPGTAREAPANREDWIEAAEKGGTASFTLPVEYLDAPIDCAAYSRKKERWYDRQILLKASSLPREALTVELPDYDRIAAALAAYEGETELEPIGEASLPANMIVMGRTGEAAEPVPVETGRPDGAYSIEVALTGGSGRASVSSPARLDIREGKAYATLLWSSPHYDYMRLGGKTYRNETADGGNSRFTIPVTAMDEPVSVTADTTAMGDPLEISYSLTFYEESIGDEGLIPQVAAKRVLIMAFVIILAGGLLNLLLRRRRR